MDIFLVVEANIIPAIECNDSHPGKYQYKQSTTVQVGTPLKPLERRILKKLIDQFQRVETIDEVYQYGQTRGDEFSIVLGFKLLTNSDNAKTAVINAVQTALQAEKLDQLLDIFFLEDDSWYQTIRGVESSFFYKK